MLHLRRRQQQPATERKMLMRRSLRSRTVFAKGSIPLGRLSRPFSQSGKTAIGARTAKEAGWRRRACHFHFFAICENGTNQKSPKASVLKRQSDSLSGPRFFRGTACQCVRLSVGRPEPLLYQPYRAPSCRACVNGAADRLGRGSRSTVHRGSLSPKKWWPFQ